MGRDPKKSVRSFYSRTDRRREEQGRKEKEGRKKEGRRKKEEERRKKEEGRRKKDFNGTLSSRLVIIIKVLPTE